MAELANCSQFYLTHIKNVMNIIKLPCRIIEVRITEVLLYKGLTSSGCFCLQDRDVQEGADMLMVKPGMAYLDIVRDVKERVRPFQLNKAILNLLFSS